MSEALPPSGSASVNRTPLNAAVEAIHSLNEQMPDGTLAFSLSSASAGGHVDRIAEYSTGNPGVNEVLILRALVALLEDEDAPAGIREVVLRASERELVAEAERQRRGYGRVYLPTAEDGLAQPLPEHDRIRLVADADGADGGGRPRGLRVGGCRADLCGKADDGHGRISAGHAGFQ